MAVVVVVFDQKMYRGAGIVNRWMLGIGGSMFTNTTGEVAKITRTGELMRGLRLNFRHPGTRQIEAIVSSHAPHTMYVIKGTAYQGKRYIYSDAGWANKAEVDRIASHRRHGIFEAESNWWMPLPPPGPKRLLRVHGQKSNNFLQAAYNKTARSHSSLHPIRNIPIQGL